ncbi:MAG: hypothetical protein WDN25_13105 [Acetobacteraceae bacterium]
MATAVNVAISSIGSAWWNQSLVLLAKILAGLRQFSGRVRRSHWTSTLPVHRAPPGVRVAKPCPHMPGSENRAAIASA